MPVLVGLALVAGSLVAEEPRGLKLWFSKPAEKWTEALPIGNGHMGAMIFGGVATERIQFNEDTLWRGKPHDYVREGAGDQLAEIRRLVFAGDSAAAGKLAKEKAISDPVRQMPYQPFATFSSLLPGTPGAFRVSQGTGLGFGHCPGGLQARRGEVYARGFCQLS